MNQPWVYMCPPSWTPSHLPPHPIPLGHPSAPALSALSHALNLDTGNLEYSGSSLEDSTAFLFTSLEVGFCYCCHRVYVCIHIFSEVSMCVYVIHCNKSVAFLRCNYPPPEISWWWEIIYRRTPWTITHQAPLSMGFSRQEYWSGQSYSSRGDLPLPGIKTRSPVLQADSLPSEPPGKSI